MDADAAPTPIVLDRGDAGVRIDRVLLRHLRHIPGASRNRLQRLIAEGAVFVNGRPVTRSSARIAPGDTLAIQLPDRRPRSVPVAEDLPLDVLHEDAELLVVNKPAGQVSHPAFRNTSGTLLNALLAHSNGRWTPALLSRLDKGTSGLVLVAKNRAMQTALQRVSELNGIEKDYLAIVHGRPSARGTIDLALDRDPWDHRRVVVRDRGGIPSVTKYERLRTLKIAEQQVSLVRCRLITGRTHQIRVHLSAKGWPIVGDVVYGRSRQHFSGRPPLIARQALHAWRLAFAHPSSGAWVDVTAPIPADMQQLIGRESESYSTRAMSSRTVASDE